MLSEEDSRIVELDANQILNCDCGDPILSGIACRHEFRVCELNQFDFSQYLGCNEFWMRTTTLSFSENTTERSTSVDNKKIDTSGFFRNCYYFFYFIF